MTKRGCTELPFMGYKLFASRTGYTGEDGFELATSIEAGRALWSQLIDAGVEPCGLGARDTLRLEAALPLWGHDIDETTNPYEAGLGWVVSLDDGAEFTGRDALARIKSAGVTRKLAHLRAIDRGVIRDGCPVLRGGERVGVVTSGSFSPTLGTSIAMAYLPRRVGGARHRAGCRRARPHRAGDRRAPAVRRRRYTGLGGVAAAATIET